MPNYLHPGVYIEEIERGPRPIEGVPTSVTAFLGATERGPTTPTLVTSYREYQRWFGGVFDPEKFMPYAASGFFENGGGQLYVCRIAPLGKGKAAEVAYGKNLTVRAVGPGIWGNQVAANIGASSTKRTGADGKSTPIGFRLRLAYWSAGTKPFDWIADTTSLPRPDFEEDFDDLVVDDETSPDFFLKRLPDPTPATPSASALATVVPGSDIATLDSSKAGGFKALTGGDDGGSALTDADFVGLPPDANTDPQGLTALEADPYRDVSLVYAPAAPTTVAQKVIAHCENLRFRFAVVDCEKAAQVTVEPRSTIGETQFGAFYFPWIVVSDPQTGAQKTVPPGGHMLGIYARTDSERGVFKAPANEIVRGALDLLTDANDKKQDVMNPNGVNAIRHFPGRGILLWGARTLSANALWKYVPVRRLFIFLERSIYEGTQWVVFEPNGPPLWARVVDTIRIFLRGQWRLGALFGRTEEQAFFVTCDETTMTRDDILNGRLICEIGIAPVRPAEFVVFRIFQNTAEAQQ
jgi:phage tail sheath protein FI